MIDKLNNAKPAVNSVLSKDIQAEKSSDKSAGNSVNNNTNNPSAVLAKADRFTLSGGAKSLSQSTIAQPDNSEKIAKLKEQIANGSYKIDPKAIANGLLSEAVSFK